MCQWNINIDCFLRYAATSLLFHVNDGAHVMQSIGKLDHQNPNIFRHGDQHLAKILGLLFARALEFDARDFCQPLD